MTEPISALPSIHPALVHLHDPPFDDYPDSYFQVLHDGVPFMVALRTDLLLAIRGIGMFLPPKQTFKKASAENCLKVLQYPTAAAVKLQTSAGELYCWTGDVMPQKQIDCNGCLGTHICHCEFCDSNHICGICEGTGKVDYCVSRPGFLMGQLVDMNKVSRLFFNLGGDCTITLRANPNMEPDLPMLRFDGPDWIALLMPMKPPGPTEPQPPADTPVFKAKEAGRGL